MIRKGIIAGVGLCLFIVSAVIAGEDSIFSNTFSDTTVNGCPGVAQKILENQVFKLVNLTRAQHGVPLLSYDPRLAKAALGHTEQMATAGYFSHTDLSGNRVGSRVYAQGYVWTSAGENIARGQRTAEQVVGDWMASPSHRRNILDPNFCHLGVGVSASVHSNCRLYWTQNFGREAYLRYCGRQAS